MVIAVTYSTWLVLVVLPVAILLLLSRSRRTTRFVSACARAIATLFVVLCVSWIVFCTHTVAVDSYEDGRAVLIVGRVADVRWAPDGRRAAFDIVDPLGRVTVVSTAGAPAQGAYAIVRGYKGSLPGAVNGGSDESAGQPFIESVFRLSTP